MYIEAPTHSDVNDFESIDIDELARATGGADEPKQPEPKKDEAGFLGIKQDNWTWLGWMAGGTAAFLLQAKAHKMNHEAAIRKAMKGRIP